MTSLEHTRTIIECPLAWSSKTAFKNDSVFPEPKIYSTLALSPTSSQTIISGQNSPAYTQNWPIPIKKLTKNRPSLGGATGASGAKLVLVGDQAVGKTTLVRKFSRGTFNDDYKATIGIDFEVVRFRILNIPFSVQLWDTAGQERFRAMSSQYYRKAKVVFIVADCTDTKSVKSVETWNRHVDSSVENSDGIFKFLILTKIDLINEAEKKDKYRDCQKLAKEINAEFWPCSSSTHENVDELFHRAVSLVFMQCCFEEIHDRESAPLVKRGTLRTHKSVPSTNFSAASLPIEKYQIRPPISHVVDLGHSSPTSATTGGFQGSYSNCC